MQVAVADLEREQNVDPPQRHRAVDVEEVDSAWTLGIPTSGSPRHPYYEPDEDIIDRWPSGPSG